MSRGNDGSVQRVICDLCGEVKSRVAVHSCDYAEMRAWRRFVEEALETALYAYARSRLCVRDRFHVE
jgi:hypothetical protein